MKPQELWIYETPIGNKNVFDTQLKSEVIEGLGLRYHNPRTGIWTTYVRETRVIEYSAFSALQDEMLDWNEKLLTEREKNRKLREALDIKKLVDRFLGWPAPESICSDLCATMHGYKGRSGTTFFTAIEAEQMFRHVLAEALAVKGDSNG